MQEENLLKMAKMATPPIMDSHMANILLCYLLYRIDRPVQVSQLYDIAVGSNIINYFAYQESISYLTEHGSVQLRRMPEGVEEYVLMGRACRRRESCATTWEKRIGTSWFPPPSSTSHG